MTTQSSILSIIQSQPDETTLWDGKYKIPWDDYDFSHRMLHEHLSQDHDLASRKQIIIDAQTQWIHQHLKPTTPVKLLDLGCGPGLYLQHFSKLGYDCTGIDFSPASIKHAKTILDNKVTLIEGNIIETEFTTDCNLITFLFGELNVFSPTQCQTILQKAFNALAPNSKLMLEVHTFDAVKNASQTPPTWYKSAPGLQQLFSDTPHLCLIENHWFEKQKTTLQQFHIIDTNCTVKSYRNTIKAWTNDQYFQLLHNAGFKNVAIHPDWPTNSESFILITADKLN